MRGKALGSGLFFASASLLMLELVLTRIFSVTHWSHFASLAISVAMFGTTLASLTVYLWPQKFPQQRLPAQLTWMAGLFAVSNVLCFPAQLFFAVNLNDPFLQALSTALFYLMVSVPFYWGGLCICLVLTRAQQRISHMYACDLLGAAMGCLLAVAVLSRVSAESAVLASGFLGALAALSFSLEGSHKKPKLCSLALLCILSSLTVYNEKTGLIQISYVKGAPDGHHDLVRWNAYSRVTLDADQPATGWGLSPIYPKRQCGRQRWLEIDAAGSTPVVAFNGDLSKVDFLAYDVTALPYYLRPRSAVAVIGSGGGKDLLTALLFGCPRPVGIEINEIIVDLLSGELRSYSGDLAQRCKIVADEGRSWLARQSEQFSVILISLVDNNAAFASGAYPISENHLYSKQAWRLIFQHLKEDGIFALTLPFREGSPVELYRAANLARATLQELGEGPIDRCFMAARLPYGFDVSPGQTQSLVTVLFSRRPFSPGDVAGFLKVCSRLKFQVVYVPGMESDRQLQALLSNENLSAVAAYPYDLQPPTDDKPYFFFSLKPGAAPLSGELADSNSKALSTQLGLLGVTAALALICIGGPLLARGPRRDIGTRWRLVYFAALGFGYISVELSQLQRLSTFLGRPVYTLSLVLFAFLLFSGLGSAVSGRLERRWRPGVIAALILTLFLTNQAETSLLPHFTGMEIAYRSLLTCLILAPVAFLMGFPFPMALSADSSAAWLYGINGIASILASASANLVALFFGVQATSMLGVGCYGFALLAARRMNFD